MNRVSTLGKVGVIFGTVLGVLLGAGPAMAGEGVYYQDPITADRPVPTPPTASCTVSLATDYVTNTPSGGAQDFHGSFTPPADCPGPWARVLLHFTGQESGRQYDRAGDISFGGARIFFTSTPEPDPDGITWHAEKDVTQYSALFTPGQAYTISVPNYLNSLDTGVMHISASLTFFAADAAHPAPGTPDVVRGLGTQYVWGSGGTDTFVADNLPTNITRAVLEVYPKGNACDEFFYSGLPDDFVAAHPSAGLCGGGPYREIDATLDGTPAGATIPFPNVFTGGVNPLIWRPIPAVDAFDMQPRYVDVTPFVGTLVDGKSHAIALSIQGAQSYWSLTPNLLLWTDHGSTQTSGALTSDTLAANPTTTSHSESTGTSSVDYSFAAHRDYTVSGWVQTSAGRVTTTVHRTLDFANRNVFELTNYRQNTTNDQSIDTTVTVTDANGTHSREVYESDPLRAVDMFQQPPPADHWMLPAQVTSEKDVAVTVAHDGDTTFSSMLRNVTSGAGVLSEYDNGQYRLANGSDDQTYDYTDSTGVCYHHRISAAQGWVTSDRLTTTC